jgi:hypothetical protein
MDQKLVEVRKRLYEDFEFYARHALRIRTKEGEIRPLVLNEPQKKFLEAVENQRKRTGKVRVIVCKGRQQGISTLIGAYMYWWTSQHRATKAIVVTHQSDSTKALFDMTKRYHENVPEILKPRTKYSSRRELSFDVLDSSYIVATAGGDAIGRGETIQLAHLSEAAFYPPATARDNINGLLQAIPNAAGSFVFIESTANGVSGPYYDIWKNAVEAKNEFQPVFIPWFLSPEYREDVPANFERTPDEIDLVEKYDLDDGQLMFRRKKIATNGLDLFCQEYPCRAEEAFLTTGRPVFNLEKCQKALNEAPDILQRLALENDQWVEHPRGELLIYKQHDPGEIYTIGADVAMGVRNGDYSVAQVLDSKRRLVASYRAHVHPDYYATVLYHLGMYFNTALIGVERNGHGILTCTRLGKDLAYPNFFTEVQVDKLTDKETISLGFSTNVKTKPLIIDELRAAQREDTIVIYDKTTLREMLTYVVTETGSMEAEPGNNDDTVMALAIANHLCEGSFTPITVTDDYYFEAI